MWNEMKEEANVTRTENGAKTCHSTLSGCLDFFASAGAMRQAPDAEIRDRFIRAFAENPTLAMKILFYARDIRGGLGERRLFRTILEYLGNNRPDTVRKNLSLIPFYGRYDDLLVLMDTPLFKETSCFLKEQLDSDVKALEGGKENLSLLAKWLPSINTSDPEKVRKARHLARAFGMNEKTYRKTLSALRKRLDVLEPRLCRKDYTFDYEEVPAKAILKYRAAFRKNDRKRYDRFQDKVENREAFIHTDTLLPYEIIRPLLNDYFRRRPTPYEKNRTLEILWNNQKDYAGGQNALAVIDGSGSMYNGGNPLPAAVAQSLALYFAERNTGSFGNRFITFSETPQLVEIRGNTLAEKLHHISTFNECANTNLKAVFELILNAAVKHHIPQKELPEKLYIISDMEFDDCMEEGDVTNFEYAKKIFREAGCRLPQVIFWNVAGDTRQFPVTLHETGTLLVSGCHPILFRQILEGKTDPYAFMLEIAGGKRYEPVTA
ncbi:DUF2828 family protein [Dialister sp.]|uniref:DUF2828 family protein n=1 Tax=Dialister sp. TaxID=1955814 RepID=UPI002E817432|nr:DUF2828 family protein [Dialister sp.]MEE3452393.1 DUF2828 family protein [Dialister sp.]